MSYSLQLANGLSETAIEVLTSMTQSGQSEDIAVAECLNEIASNGDGSESDEHLVACAHEIRCAADLIIEKLGSPTAEPSLQDVMDALVREHGSDRVFQSFASSLAPGKEPDGSWRTPTEREAELIKLADAQFADDVEAEENESQS